jgi:hypothetical protein
LRIAFLATALVFLLLLVFQLSWSSALIAGLSVSVLLTFVYYLTRPNGRAGFSNEQLILTMSVLIGYWLSLYSLMSSQPNDSDGEAREFSPGSLALGLLLLLVPFVWTAWLRSSFMPDGGRDSRSRGIKQGSEFVTGESTYNLERGLEHSETERGLTPRDYPKPQIVSVVYNWPWVNLIIVIYGILPAILGAILFAVLYGPRSILEGFAGGAILTAFALLFVVWNQL